MGKVKIGQLILEQLLDKMEQFNNDYMVTTWDKFTCPTTPQWHIEMYRIAGWDRIVSFAEVMQEMENSLLYDKVELMNSGLDLTPQQADNILELYVGAEAKGIDFKEKRDIVRWSILHLDRKYSKRDVEKLIGKKLPFILAQDGMHYNMVDADGKVVIDERDGIKAILQYDHTQGALMAQKAGYYDDLLEALEQAYEKQVKHEDKGLGKQGTP